MLFINKEFFSSIWNNILNSRNIFLLRSLECKVFIVFLSFQNCTCFGSVCFDLFPLLFFEWHKNRLSLLFYCVEVTLNFICYLEIWTYPFESIKKTIMGVFPMKNVTSVSSKQEALSVYFSWYYIIHYTFLLVFPRKFMPW